MDFAAPPEVEVLGFRPRLFGLAADVSRSAAIRRFNSSGDTVITVLHCSMEARPGFRPFGVFGGLLQGSMMP
jgi:hypothetical protein